MIWVSIQEDIIKRLEGSLRGLRDSPDAETLRNRCFVLLKELEDRMQAVDGGDGHIAWRLSELQRDRNQIEKDLIKYQDRNVELRAEIKSLNQKLEESEQALTLLKCEIVKLRKQSAQQKAGMPEPPKESKKQKERRARQEQLESLARNIAKSKLAG